MPKIVITAGTRFGFMHVSAQFVDYVELDGLVAPGTGLEKTRFFEKKIGFFRFFRFFLGYLGFNVHNAEHRYMTHDK